MEYARRIRDDRGKANLVIIEQGDENLLNGEELKVKFFKSQTHIISR